MKIKGCFLVTNNFLSEIRICADKWLHGDAVGVTQ